MASFLGEIKRRKVFQVAAVYLVVAWLIAQVTDVVNEPLSLPGWFDTVVILFLALGFPIPVLISWAFDVTPHGVIKDEGTAARPSGGRSIEYVLIGVLVIAVGWLLYRDIGSSEQATVSNPELIESLPNSIAILPFENMSVDPEDAFFAAGIHDEILNQVAKISDLNVIARTSVLQYEGVRRPITEIARELNVASVLEGSVSYAGERVRIRAQLIDGSSGAHLWSEVFQGSVSDVFAIYADISRRIADSLEAELLPSEQESIEQRPTDSTAAYALYLKSLSHAASIDALTDLEQAIALDPDFALAHATKSMSHATLLIGFGGAASAAQAAEFEGLARESAETALSLDSSLGRAHGALAAINIANRRWLEADQALQEALQLSPSDPEILQMQARLKRYQGEFQDAVELMQRAVNLDPNNPNRIHNLGVAYRYARNYEAASSAFRRALEFDPTSIDTIVNLARSEVVIGNDDSAVQQLGAAEALSGLDEINTFRLTQMALTYSQAGRPDEASRLFDVLEQRAATEPVSEATWARAYIAIGEYDRALLHLEAAVTGQDPTDVATLAELAANVSRDPVLETDERFRKLLGSLEN